MKREVPSDRASLSWPQKANGYEHWCGGGFRVAGVLGLGIGAGTGWRQEEEEETEKEEKKWSLVASVREREERRRIKSGNVRSNIDAPSSHASILSQDLEPRAPARARHHRIRV